MKNSIECPFCPYKAIRLTKKTEVTYKEKIYLIDRNYYHCLSCKQKFTTNEMDEFDLNQLYTLANEPNK